MAVHYTKPHLDYEEQVRMLTSRGMDVGPETEAVQAPKRIGYYRLAAYTYPMRMQGDQTGNGRVPRADQFAGRIAHELVEADRSKVHFLASVLTYLLGYSDKGSRFESDFRTVMNKFPPVMGMTPENTMGFVSGRKDQALWALGR